MEKLRALQLERIFLSARSEIQWRPPDAELIVDPPPSRGPISGLAAALVAIETDHLLVLAVDMPFMTTEHLRSLCDLVASGVGVIPMIDEKAEPLSAIYPREARDVFVEAMEGENFSLQPIVSKLITFKLLRAVPVSGLTRDLYKSINEPRDVPST